MRVRITEERILNGRDEYLKDEERTVSDELGNHFCNMGWAIDIEGKVPSAERDPNRVVRLDVQSSNHSVKGGSANG